MNPAVAPPPGDRKRRGQPAARLFAVLFISGFSIVLTLSSLKLLFVPMGWLGLDLIGDTVYDIDPGTAAVTAGVRIGDRLAPDTPFFARQAIAFSNHFGRAEYSFDVVRNGRLKHIDAIAAKPEPNLGPVGYAAFPIFATAVFAFIVCAILATFVLLSNPSRLTWSFYLFCIGAMVPWFGSIAIAQTVPMPFGFVIQIVRVTLLSLGLFAGLDFALRFPTGKAPGWRKPLAWATPVLGLAYLAWEYLTWFSAGTNFFAIDPNDRVDVGVKVSIAVFSIAGVVGTYLSSASTQRQRVKWTVVGISLGYSAIAGHDILFRFGLFEGYLQFVTWCFVLAAFLAPFSGSIRDCTPSRHRRALRSESRRRISHAELDPGGRTGVDVLDYQSRLTAGSRGRIRATRTRHFFGRDSYASLQPDGFWNRSPVFPAALHGAPTPFRPSPAQGLSQAEIAGRIGKTRRIRAGHCL